LGVLTPTTAVLTAGIVNWVGFLVGVASVPHLDLKYRTNIAADMANVKEIFGFGKWVAIWFVLGTLIPRVDLMIIQTISNPITVGLYSAAVRLGAPLQLVTGSMNMVVIPYVSRMSDWKDLRRFLQKYLFSAVLLGSVLYLFLFNLSDSIISLVFGTIFIPAGPIFQALIVGFLFDMMGGPLVYLSYPLERPHWLTFSHGLRLVAVIALGFSMGTRWGALGLAWAISLSTAISLSSLIACLTLDLMRHESRSLEEANAYDRH
jgi:O-antigen/teichoic acid export membrane protein